MCLSSHVSLHTNGGVIVTLNKSRGERLEAIVCFGSWLAFFIATYKILLLVDRKDETEGEKSRWKTEIR